MTYLIPSALYCGFVMLLLHLGRCGECIIKRSGEAIRKVVIQSYE